MKPVFLLVDVHFQGMFARNPIRYTSGITQRFSDIDFAGMDKDGCVAFIERFTGEKCEKLYYCQPDIDFPKDHFGDSNIQEWLDEHKDEFVGNVEEEVLDGAGLVKEVAPGYRDVGDSDTNDEVQNGDDDDDEDEDVDGNEDDHQKPHFFIKGNESQVEMGEKAGAGEFFEEDMGDNEDVYPELPNIFNDKLNWKEQELVLGMRFESPKQLKHMLCNYAVANGYQLCFVKNDTRRLLVKCCDGKWDDEVIVDATDALDRPRDEERMVGVNGRDEGVNVNARVKHVKPRKMRKKSERIIKLKLAKNVGGEGSSVATAMDLD
ncbi:unnamed protein product [Lactuca saligna]|uniref:Transposase MuDR plant domain-containing protein n=1 Tax=Lactuca saligna TaxID=75948 RepID=A0AA35Z894_LACSI|nr:unnamed protein product [Lactuca saligna]